MFKSRKTNGDGFAFGTVEVSLSMRYKRAFWFLLSSDSASFHNFLHGKYSFSLSRLLFSIWRNLRLASCTNCWISIEQLWPKYIDKYKSSSFSSSNEKLTPRSANPFVFRRKMLDCDVSTCTISHRFRIQQFIDWRQLEDHFIPFTFKSLTW